MITGIKSVRYVLMLLLIALSSSGSPTSAYEPAKVDLQLAALVGKISSTDAGQYEKVGEYCQKLMKYLESVCTDTKVMNSSLSGAQKAGLQVVTSDDRKLRFFSWYTNNGGTMGIFDALVVYDSGNGKLKYEVLHPRKDSEPGDSGSKYERMDTIKTRDKRTVYLVQDASSYSSILGTRRIEAYIISNGKLTGFPFFQTPKETLDRIEHPWVGWEPGDLIQLSQDKQTLRIPLIKTDKDDNSKATGKFLDYHFNGLRYAFDKKSTK